MAATYDSNLSTPKDLVRFYLGDTTTTSAMFQDEEIAAILAITSNPLLAAAILAEGAAAKFSRAVSFAVEGLSFQNREKSENFRKLALMLRSRAESGEGTPGWPGVGGPSTPVVTGISEAAMDAPREDTDRFPSSFEVGGWDYPGGNPLLGTTRDGTS